MCKDLQWISCPNCKTEDYEKVAKELSMYIVKCRHCNLMFVNPQLKTEKRPYWGGKHGSKKYDDIFSGKKEHNRTRNYREHLQIIKAIKPTGRFLDIGTHRGFFLNIAARNMDWELYGVEPSPIKAKLAREKFGLNVLTGYLNDANFDDKSFDIITMVDVFEHIPQPLPLLKEVHRILKDDGILFIKVPHGNYNLFKHVLFRRLLRIKIPIVFDTREHVVQYTPESIVLIMEKSGFTIEKFYIPYPIQTDSWYKRFMRRGLYETAKLYFKLSGKINFLSPDIALIARKQAIETKRQI